MENKEPKKKKYTGLKNFLSSNLNAIAITLLAGCNIILSVFTVADGEVNLRPMPVTAIGWILWLVQIIAPAAIAILIFQMFRQSGIAEAHEKFEHLREARKEYIEAISGKEGEKSVLSEKEFYKKGAKKDISTKLPISLLTGLLMVSLGLTFNISALLGLFFQTIITLGFGFNTKLGARKYAGSDLYIWYKREVAKIKAEQENEEKAKKQDEDDFQKSCEEVAIEQKTDDVIAEAKTETEAKVDAEAIVQEPIEVFENMDNSGDE